jgi:hypothetical protein
VFKSFNLPNYVLQKSNLFSHKKNSLLSKKHVVTCSNGYLPFDWKSIDEIIVTEKTWNFVFLLRKANLDPLFSPLPAVRQHHIIYNPNFKLYITLGYENFVTLYKSNKICIRYTLYFRVWELWPFICEGLFVDII